MSHQGDSVKKDLERLFYFNTGNNWAIMYSNINACTYQQVQVTQLHFSKFFYTVYYVKKQPQYAHFFPAWSCDQCCGAVPRFSGTIAELEQNCKQISGLSTELGTRQYCRDNVTRFSGQTIVDYCTLTISFVVTLLRHRAVTFFVRFLCIKSSTMYVVELSLSRS